MLAMGRSTLIAKPIFKFSIKMRVKKSELQCAQYNRPSVVRSLVTEPLILDIRISKVTVFNEGETDAHPKNAMV